MCPLAIEYVRTGHAKIIDDKMCLPNKQPIPNDGSGRGIKAGIDAWLTSQATPTPPPPRVAYAPPPPPPLSKQHAPPAAHIEEVTEANILQVTQITQTPEQDPSEDSGLDIFQVFAAEKKKRDSKAYQPAKLAEVPPMDQPPMPSDSHTTRPTMQYCYHSNAEDQQLASELYTWLLEGKLSLATPAHILATSPTIRKEAG
jgi:hypothetical protein